MASHRLRTTKGGKPYYEITISRGRGKSYVTKRWYPPEGWSQKSIDRELAKVEADLEREVKEGKVVTKKEQKQLAAQKAAEQAKIQTLRQYGEQMFMPTFAIRAAENSRASYQGALDRWIYPVLGEIKLPDITPTQITALLLGLQSQGKSHATAVKAYTVLQGMFKMAARADVIAHNPMDRVERPKARKDELQKEPDSYTPQQVVNIMAALEQEPLKWRVFVHILIDTGCRRGEVLGLTWENLDLEQGTATILQTCNYTPKKGVYLDTPKNRKPRVVYLSPKTVALLKEYRPREGKGFVFRQKDGGPMHPTSVDHYLRLFAKKNGIEHLHPHAFRHTFASLSITNGADVASVSKSLGHSNTDVTLRIYTHAKDARVVSSLFQSVLAEAEIKADTKTDTETDTEHSRGEN